MKIWKNVFLMVVGLYIISSSFSVEFVVDCSLFCLKKCLYNLHSFVLKNTSLGSWIASRNMDSSFEVYNILL